MIEAQQVTIQEYFSEMRQAQINAKPSERYNYAKDYMNNRCGLKKDGIAFTAWVRKAAAEQNVSTGQLAAKLALKELNLRIENDFLEFVAEMGIKTYEALKKDADVDEARSQFFARYGYLNQKDPTAVELLRNEVDLYLVSRKDKPGYFVTNTNPFLYNQDDPFVEATDKVTPDKVPDWDTLSEEEWQKMKEADAEERLQRRLNTVREKEAEAVKRAERALSLLEESTPDTFYY